ICGEYTCDGIPNDYLGVLAKKFGAAVVSLEHHYYGKSSPFKSLSTENLKYLSSKQALFDLAIRFIFFLAYVLLGYNFKFAVKQPSVLIEHFSFEFVPCLHSVHSI
ncbi:hypothetical protein CISIN_1g046985mg, partial [Citrus sinensis]